MANTFFVKPVDRAQRFVYKDRSFIEHQLKIRTVINIFVKTI